jgi:hypothetical protein
MYHDAIFAEDIFLVGGGVGYQLSNALAASLSARLFVTGTQNASVLALGVTWSPLISARERRNDATMPSRS